MAVFSKHTTFAHDNRSAVHTLTIVVTQINAFKMKKTTNDFTQAELNEFFNAASTDFSARMEKQTDQGAIPAPSSEASPLADLSEEGQDEDSLSPTVKKESALSVTSAPPLAPDTTLPTVTRRVSSKQRKLSLDEYRATFLQVPKVVNRRPVFVSEEVRQKLDLIVLRLSDTRRMSVTGLLENICRHHIVMYEDDIEQWRKL